MNHSGITGLTTLAQLAEAHGRRFHLLIVDDEPWVRDAFREFAELSEAVTVDIASCGNEAVESVRSTEYDLITVDLIMPDISGLEAIAEFKAIRPKTPIMIITGNATEKLIREAGVQGAARVLHKPVALETFVSAVASMLGRYYGMNV